MCWLDRRLVCRNCAARCALAAAAAAAAARSLRWRHSRSCRLLRIAPSLPTATAAVFAAFFTDFAPFADRVVVATDALPEDPSDSVPDAAAACERSCSTPTDAGAWLRATLASAAAFRLFFESWPLS